MASFGRKPDLHKTLRMNFSLFEFLGEIFVILPEAVETYGELWQKTGIYTKIHERELGLLTEVCLYSSVYVKDLTIYEIGCT